MKKLEFIYALRDKLRGLPLEDIEKSVEYYTEMIDDRIDDGMDEESAVSDVGNLDDIVAQILNDTPIPRLVKEKLKKKRKMRAWEIVLLSVGSPLWLALIITAFAIVFSLYAALWSIVISSWAVFVSLAASSLGLLAGSFVMLAAESIPSFLLCLGVSLICAGIAIMFFFVSKYAVRGAVFLGRKIILGIKRCFISKEESR